MILPKLWNALTISIVLALTFGGNATAAPISWTDWTGSDVDAGPGFTGNGVIATAGGPIDVTFSNPLGISFFNTGAAGEIDYWSGNGLPRDAATSPYTSTTVDNIPTGTDLIALQYAGLQTLTFSQAVTNAVFSFVSLNGGDGPNQQYYAFLNQDFRILSLSDGGFVDLGEPSNACGYWGCGIAGREVVDLGGGNVEYRLVSPGGTAGFAGYEPHGTIELLGTFSSVTWRSKNNEGWNGFTVGVADTGAPSPVPEPGTLLMLSLGTASMLMGRKRSLRRSSN